MAMTTHDEEILEGFPFLQFQPAVDLMTGRLLGFEAFVRWQHPTKGLITPDVLIPWAEKNGHIGALNAWILAEASRQAADWPSAIQISVNCSTTELREGRMSVATAAALEESGLNPDRLTIEVKEATVGEPAAKNDLHALSQMGVRLAVDNVGTSWSGLANLRPLAIETAKIDREFISALEPSEGVNRAITEAIIQVSHTLAISTVAEGVETAEQVAVLREFGADVAQGYFFARPLPSEKAHLMANAEPRTVFAFTPEIDKTSTKSDEPCAVTVLPRPDDTELEIPRVHVL